MAAIRECFEEAGALLARFGNDELSLSEPALNQRFQRHREAVYSGDLTMVELCRKEGLHLNFDDLRYVSHWITPVGPLRRFDTRFLLLVPRKDSDLLTTAGKLLKAVGSLHRSDGTSRSRQIRDDYANSRKFGTPPGIAIS